MTLSIRQKVLAGLCAVGLAVVLIDRLFARPAVLGPQGALASVAGLNPAALTDSPAGMPADAADTAANGKAEALANRLKAAAGDGPVRADDMRDAFQPSPAWIPTAPRNHEKAAGGTAAEAFMQRHTLKAIVVGPDGHQALIDNTCLAVGQTIDGFELVSAGERRAVLVSQDGSRLTLELPANADARSD